MIEFDSQRTKSPSLITGTRPLGFKARNSGVSVALKPDPQSSRSKGSRNCAHTQSTLRTLMEEAFPRIFSMGGHHGRGRGQSTRAERGVQCTVRPANPIPLFEMPL